MVIGRGLIMSNNESENNVNRGKDVSMSQRQIYILSLLSENPRGYQAEDIRKRLLSWDIDVSRRTILRDIDELSLNYGILEDERDGKTYYYADKYTLKNVDLTIEDLASLAFAKEMLKEYSHIEMGVHAVSFIDRIVKNSAALNKLQFERLCKSFRQNNVNGNKDNVDWFRNNNSSFIDITNNSPSRIRTSSFAIEGGETYTVSGMPQGIIFNTVRCYSEYGGNRTNEISSNPFTLPNTTKYIHLLFNGENLTDESITLMKNANIKLEQGTVATPYSPYGMGSINEYIRPKQLFNNTVAVLSIVLITAIIVFVLDVAFESMNKYGVDKIKQDIVNSSTNNTENNETINENTDDSAVDNQQENSDTENQETETVEENNVTE